MVCKNERLSLVVILSYDTFNKDKETCSLVSSFSINKKNGFLTLLEMA